MALKKSQRNTLTDGMLLDVHASVRKPSTTGLMKNFRVITRDNTSFVITNVKGTEHKGNLTSGYLPLGSEERNGVAYIISHNPTTGLGEIGCFPSPDYSTGAMTYVYRPLMNYSGDDNLDDTKASAFRSTHFNFDLVNLLDIELQNDYDGSVNIIFTDGNNPIRIINSGFVVLPGEKYELIDRAGVKDTNRYTPANFENVINLITTSTKLLKVTFEESVAGGVLPHGNVQVYFAYGTSDGNETEIIGQSFSVPVFNGDKVGNAAGGRVTGEASNKMLRFTLSNLDESYAYIQMFAVHADGMNAAIKTAYRINQRYNILNSSMEIVYTGYEDKIIMPVEDLLGEAVMIKTAETLAQSDNRLVLGNVTEKEYNIEAIKKFCRMIKLGHKEVTLDMIGQEDGFTRLYDEALNQSTLKAGTDGYNGGYVNPKNVHDRLGYWGGEAYPFAARVFFPDGSASPLFPVVGIDNADNTQTVNVDDATLEQIDALDATSGFGTTGNMLNSKGIYRFPNRNIFGNADIFSRDATTTEGRIAVNGVTFKIPELDVDLGDGTTIKDHSIGIQFFRGERKPDALVQGLLIDCQLVPLTRQDEGEDEDLYFDTYRESNSKLIPAFYHLLESIHRWDTELSGSIFSNDRTRYRNTDKDNDQFIGGIWPLKMDTWMRDTMEIFAERKSAFAMLGSDLILNPLKYSGTSSREIGAKLLYQFQHTARVKTGRAGQSEGTGDHFSVMVPKSSTSTFGESGTFPGRASWMSEGMEARNADGFSSEAHFQHVHRDGKAYLFKNKYNSYMGVRLQAEIRAANPGTTDGGEYAVGLIDKDVTASFLANLYAGSDQRTADAVQQVYQNIDGIRYFPISGRMYWDADVEDADPTNTLESQLDANRKFTCYNGDCFINYTLRKLYSNATFDEPEAIDNDQVRIGYTIGIVNEGNENAAFRSLETVDLVEGERKHPLAYVSKNSPVGDAYGRNNLWREYWLTESAALNKGYSSVNGSVLTATLPQDAPYIQSRWTTRAWPSAQHIQNSFENGYRRFLGLNYKDYPTKNGEIIKLIDSNGILYCVQENSVGIIGVNERIQTGNGAGGPVYLEATDVLSPKMKMVSEEIGSQHKGSIVGTDNGIYGVSMRRSVIWQVMGDKMTRVSDMAIRSYLDENFEGESLAEIEHLEHNIISSWNKKYDEVLFTFYKNESGYANDRSFTVQFNEISNKIHSFYGFVPMVYMKVGDDLYSFNVKSQTGKIWLHDSDNVAMNNFYGIQDDSIVAVAVNADEGEKTFTNLAITGNKTMPDSIVYRVLGALAEHDLAAVVNNIRASNAKYKRGAWRVVIPKITEVHNQDAEQKVESSRAGAESELSVGSRVKGKFMIAEVHYNSGNLIELKEIDTIYSIPA